MNSNSRACGGASGASCYRVPLPVPAWLPHSARQHPVHQQPFANPQTARSSCGCMSWRSPGCAGTAGDSLHDWHPTSWCKIQRCLSSAFAQRAEIGEPGLVTLCNLAPFPRALKLGTRDKRRRFSLRWTSSQNGERVTDGKPPAPSYQHHSP